MMHAALLATLMVSCLTTASVVPQKRAVDGPVQYYGYGSGINGLPLFFGQYNSNSSLGGAYLGYGAPPDAASVTNVTLTEETNNTTMLAKPSASNSTTQQWLFPSLFINNSSGSFEPAGFISASEASGNDSITTAGFQTYGAYLMWLDSNDKLQSQWWAEETSTDGIYRVLWNTDGVESDSAIPVAIKSTKPTDLTSS